MKNEKMFTKLLTLLFLFSLTFNLFSQEKTKKEQKVIVKNSSKKNEKKLVWIDKENSSNVVWNVKGDEFEWDTTFTIEGDENVDIDAFLKKRFPEMDTMKNKNISIRMEGNRILKFSNAAHHNKLIELKNNVFIDEDGEAITFHIEEMDSLLSNNKMLKSFVIKGDLSSNFKTLHENLDGLKYEILTSIDEDDNDHSVRLEVLNNVKEKLNAYAYVLNDSDEYEGFDIRKIDDFHLSIVLDSDLEKEDIDILKKSGIKVSENKLDLTRLYLYTGEDGLFNLKFKLKTEGKTTIKVITDKGDEIYSDKVQYFPGIYDKQTKISMEAKGVYYICIEQNNSSYIGKVKFE